MPAIILGLSLPRARATETGGDGLYSVIADEGRAAGREHFGVASLNRQYDYHFYKMAVVGGLKMCLSRSPVSHKSCAGCVAYGPYLQRFAINGSGFPAPT